MTMDDYPISVEGFYESPPEPLWSRTVTNDEDGMLQINFRHATEEELVAAVEYLQRQREQGL